MIAHVAGVPVEELLLALGSGAGAGLLLARAWVASPVPLRTKSQETGARAWGASGPYGRIRRDYQFIESRVHRYSQRG